METKRIIVFIFGCILTRLIITYIAKITNKENLKLMGYLALPFGLSFIYLYFIGNKRADSQLEWLGDKKIWWNKLRIIHGFNYLLFANYAIKQKDFAWQILFADTIIGLTAWLIHHKIIKF